MDKKKALACAVYCTCWFGVCAPAAAQTSDWRPILGQPESEARGPSDTIWLELPPMPVNVLQSIALELDDVDVTGLVNSDGRRASFTPPQPLSYGEHSLRLVEYAPDGNIIERGVWTLDIRKTAAFRDASLQANVALNAVRRVSDDGLNNPKPNANQLNGGAQLSGALAGDGWRTTGYIELLGNSEKTAMPRQDQTVDMGRFLVAGESGPVSAQAGDHRVGPESLVLQNFSRRGVSVALRSPENAASVVGFSMRSEDIIGFQEGLGVGDASNRTDGVVVSGHPFSSDRDALVLIATYVAGEGPSQSGGTGSGTVGDPTVTRGEAMSVVADSRILEKRLRLRGEVAQTRFDFDGEGRDADLDGDIDSDLPHETSRAQAALVTYMPWHDKEIAGRPLALSFGLEKRRVGSFFQSPANPAGGADRDLLRGFTSASWSGLDLQFVRANESDNVDDLELIPRTETNQTYIAAGYVPQSLTTPDENGQLPPMPWYGQPSFNASWLELDQGITRATADFGTGALRKGHVTTLGAAFAYTQWNWSITHTLSDMDEFSGFAPDVLSRTTQLSGRFQIGERLTFTPSYELSRVEQRDPPAGFLESESDTVTACLSVSYVFSERVNAALTYSAIQQKIDDGSEQTSTDVSAAVNWTAVAATGLRPGLSLALEGSRHESDDPLIWEAFRDKHQIFMKAAMTWSPSF